MVLYITMAALAVQKDGTLQGSLGLPVCTKVTTLQCTFLSPMIEGLSVTEEISLTVLHFGQITPANKSAQSGSFYVGRVSWISCSGLLDLASVNIVRFLIIHTILYWNYH